MKIGVIGGGPAGLFYAYLMKRDEPSHEIRVIGHLRKQGIASFKLPERLEVMASFPVSPVGKILKRELRDLVAQRLSSEATRP